MQPDVRIHDAEGPWTQEIADWAGAALEELPPELAAKIDNLAVLICERAPGMATDSPFGMYTGVPLTFRGDGGPLGPDIIEIYREPLVRAFGADPERLRSETRITTLHELGHYFGMDEARLAELGFG